MKLVFYTLLTLTATVLVVWHAFECRVEFFPSMIYLTSTKLNLVVLGNLAFWFILTSGNIIRSIFLGPLSEDETQHVFEQARYAMTETCLALTIFREELDLRVLGLFFSLLVVKMFHWLAQLRVDNISRLEGVSLWSHMRLCSLLGFLFLLDAFLALAISYFVLLAEHPSVLFLFAFEYTILAVSAAATQARYVLLRLDAHWEGRWANKMLAVFIIEVMADFTRLVLYAAFFVIVCVYYGLPVHLIREVYIAFYSLHDRITKFVLYRRMTRNMNERFPPVTAAHLDTVHDLTCIICRDDLSAESARLLPCGHLFHVWCLRRWLENDLRCPTCRFSLQPLLHAPPLPAGPPPPGPAVQAQVQAQAHAQARAQGQASAAQSAAQPHFVHTSQSIFSAVNYSSPSPQTIVATSTLSASTASTASASSSLPAAFPSLPPPLFAPTDPTVSSLHLHAELFVRQSILMQQHISSVQRHLEQMHEAYSQHCQMQAQFVASHSMSHSMSNSMSQS